jgi:hypothetical protein
MQARPGLSARRHPVCCARARAPAQIAPPDGTAVISTSSKVLMLSGEGRISDQQFTDA